MYSILNLENDGQRNYALRAIVLASFWSRLSVNLPKGQKWLESKIQRFFKKTALSMEILYLLK